jgi:hypothetical protein
VLLVRFRSAVAVLVTAAAGGLGCLVAPAAAAAEACPGSTGVTVVVEYGAVGSGTSTGCAADGGGQTADRLLKATGHALTYVQRFPGFVCRIDGLPGDDPCVNTPPADAYWGLWWSDGKTGEWSYSSLGAGSLAIPAGGYVAMVWDGSTGTVRPQADPAPHPTPTPSPTPTPTPTKKPSPTATATPTPRPSSTPSASSSPDEPTAAPSRTKKPKPTPSPSTSPAETTSAPSPEPSADEQTEAGGVAEDPVDPSQSTQSSEAGDDGGLPVWVAPVVVVVLLGAAGGVAVARRRQQP